MGRQGDHDDDDDNNKIPLLLSPRDSFFLFFASVYLL